jgi:CRP/FNR family transcriptional regulator
MATQRAVTQTLESRALPTTNRNAVILEAFDKLPVGGILELDDEQDPRALRNEFLQHRAGRFAWQARNRGTGRWTIRIERVDEHSDLPTFIAHCPPMLAAKAQTIRDLSSVATERHFRSGEIIYDEGEVWPYLAFVRSGKVVYSLLSQDGKTTSIGERVAYDSLNETGVFDGGGATTRAEALTSSHVVLIPAEAVLNACRGDAELAVGFLVETSQARRRSIDTIADLAFAHVLQRVAKFLISYAPQTTGMAKGLEGVENLSQAQIAAAAGTVRDMAARALIRLRGSGAVELERGRVRSIDREKLEAYAQNVQAPPV